jgi:hypothetical protein
MKINIPVGCVVLVKETFTIKNALRDRELIFNTLISKLQNTEYTSTGLTDINDEGDFCIVEVTKNGIKKTKYEDWKNTNKSIEIYNLKFEHSKEKLYKILDVLQETKNSKKQKLQLYYKYFLFSLSRRINPSYKPNMEVPTLTTGQFPGYVWNKVKQAFPFWKDHTAKSLKFLLSLHSELLFKGNSEEL